MILLVFCYKKCPLECDSVMYNRMTSFSYYPSSTELTSGLTDAAVQEMRLKVLKVNIYCEYLLCIFKV